MPLWFDLMMTGGAGGGAGGGTTFIIVGDSGKLATSTDGINWILQTSSFGTTNINDVNSKDGIAFACGDAGKARYSSNYTSWSSITTGTGVLNLQKTAVGTTNILIVGDSAAQSWATTPNGVWTFVNTFDNTQDEVFAAATNGTEVGLVRDTTLEPFLYYSDFTNSFSFVSIIPAKPVSVAYGNGIYVATIKKSSSSEIWTSTSLEGTFTRRVNDGTKYDIQNASFCGGVFLVWFTRSGGSKLYISADGITWAVGTAPTSANVKGNFAFGNGLYVGAFGNGTLYTSPNYTTWTARTSGFSSSSINGITFA